MTSWKRSVLVFYFRNWSFRLLLSFYKWNQAHKPWWFSYLAIKEFWIHDFISPLEELGLELDKFLFCLMFVNDSFNFSLFCAEHTSKIGRFQYSAYSSIDVQTAKLSSDPPPGLWVSAIFVKLILSTICLAYRYRCQREKSLSNRISLKKYR